MADLLVVEDNPDIAESIEELLVARGHSVRLAEDGRRGLAALRCRLPDLVIMDVEMPVMSGPGMAYRMIVEDAGKETVPVVIVSGAPELRSIAADVGTPYFLAKPFSSADLYAVTARALEQRTPPTPRIG